MLHAEERDRVDSHYETIDGRDRADGGMGKVRELG
jgi:hypothetical protein